VKREITITKLSRSGKPPFSYPGEVVFRDEAQIVARCLWSLKSLDLGPFRLEPGDVFIEYYYLAEPFNIFKIHDTLGRLKGWYCNITESLEVTGYEIRWHDLALDLLVLPDGRQILLDEDEFEALRPSEDLRLQADQALATLRRWAREGFPPFLMTFDGQGIPSVL
jgi:uncharacterized protein